MAEEDGEGTYLLPDGDGHAEVWQPKTQRISYDKCVL